MIGNENGMLMVKMNSNVLDNEATKQNDAEQIKMDR